MSDNKRAFNEEEAAAYIGMSRAFLRMNRKYDNHPPGNRTPGPRFVRVSHRRVLYLKDDLDRWLDSLQATEEQA